MPLHHLITEQTNAKKLLYCSYLQTIEVTELTFRLPLKVEFRTAGQPYQMISMKFTSNMGLEEET